MKQHAERDDAFSTYLRDKFRGALLGGAVGDAVGAPFEGTAPASGKDARTLDQTHALLRYTDDTQMTLGLAESLLAAGGFDGAAVAARFAQDYFAAPWRGYGAGPPQIFRLLEQGVPWDQASRTLFGGTGSWGNGAAMRVAPVALIAFQDLKEVAALAHQSAIITHSHDLGIAGAVLHALAIARVLAQPATEPLDPENLLMELHASVPSGVFQSKLLRIAALLPKAAPDEVIAQLGTGSDAHESVPTALYAFLRSPQSFTTAVTYAVSLGGDTDTIAAMTGTLIGAYQGVKAIPAAAREHVEGRDRLMAVADALVELARERVRAAASSM